jgi:hypothetical protein
MTKRPAVSSTKATKATDPAASSALRRSHAPSVGITQRAADRAVSLEDAEERYVAAREAWAGAMRGAASGRPADLATLAVTQEAYEAALAERDRWASGARVPIPVEPDRPKSIEAAVRQEVTWRLAHQGEPDGKRPKGLRGLFRRMRGR